eukprot:2979605-Rhodomonas_salina.1
MERRIKDALCALYLAEDELSPSEPLGSPLRAEFHAQEERLRFQLLKLMGETSLVEFEESKGRGGRSLPTEEGALAAKA